MRRWTLERRADNAGETSPTKQAYRSDTSETIRELDDKDEKTHDEDALKPRGLNKDKRADVKEHELAAGRKAARSFCHLRKIPIGHTRYFLFTNNNNSMKQKRVRAR